MSTQSAREHTERHAQETTEKKVLRCMACCESILLNINKVITV